MVTNLDMAFYTALIISTLYKVADRGPEQLLWTIMAGVFLLIDMYLTYKGR